MREPPDADGPRPAVYARLAAEAEARVGGRTPPRSARWFGWLLCLALGAAIVAAAIRVDPW